MNVNGNIYSKPESPPLWGETHGWRNIAAPNAGGTTRPGDNLWINNIAMFKITGGIIGVNHKWYYDPTLTNGSPNHNVSWPLGISFSLDNSMTVDANCFVYSVRSSIEEIENLSFLTAVVRGYYQYSEGDTGDVYRFMDNYSFLDDCNRQDSLLLSLAAENSLVDSILNYRNQLLNLNVGKLYHSLQYFQHKEFSQSMSMLNSMQGPTIAESKMNTVINLLNYYAINDSLFITEEHFNLLYSLSQEEPMFSGPAVTMAKAMIAAFDENYNKNAVNENPNIPIKNNASIPEICPNPNHGEFRICNSKDVKSLEIFNVHGVKLNHYINNINGTISLENVSSGIYFYKIFRGNSELNTGKFIVH